MRRAVLRASSAAALGLLRQKSDRAGPPLYNSMTRQKFSHNDKTGSWAADAEAYAKRINNFYTLNETTRKDVFTTSNLSTVRGAAVHAAYGGLIFSQALAAAERTVEDEFKPHATHSFFILNVDTRIPVEYHVRRLRDGRSFCTRTVEAVQNGKVAFCLQASFHKDEPDSVVHQAEMPDVPPPEDCVTNRDFAIFTLKKADAGEITVTDMQRVRLEFQANYDPDGDLFEIRCVAPDTHLGFTEPTTLRTLCFWMKTQFPVERDCERLHRYLLGFTSDSVLAGTAYLPHLVNDFVPSMIFSLDHCVWIHEPKFRADEWVLYECKSDKAKGSRGFTEGRLWSRDGKLLMSVVQEALVRTKTATSKI